MILGGTVGEESFSDQFTRLEDKIREVVQRSRDLQETKSALEARIYELEEALRVKMAAERQYAEEKSIIGAKIESLLSRLDETVEQG